MLNKRRKKTFLQWVRVLLAWSALMISTHPNNPDQPTRPDDVEREEFFVTLHFFHFLQIFLTNILTVFMLDLNIRQVQRTGSSKWDQQASPHTNLTKCLKVDSINRNLNICTFHRGCCSFSQHYFSLLVISGFLSRWIIEWKYNWFPKTRWSKDSRGLSRFWGIIAWSETFLWLRLLFWYFLREYNLRNKRNSQCSSQYDRYTLCCRTPRISGTMTSTTSTRLTGARSLSWGSIWRSGSWWMIIIIQGEAIDIHNLNPQIFRSSHHLDDESTDSMTSATNLDEILSMQVAIIIILT